jgi:hypothetical protein
MTNGLLRMHLISDLKLYGDRFKELLQHQISSGLTASVEMYILTSRSRTPILSSTNDGSYCAFEERRAPSNTPVKLCLEREQEGVG